MSRRNWAICLILALSGASAQADEAYQPTAIQLMVDRSFSNTLIGTPFNKIQPRVTPVAKGCEYADCEWRDTNGIRYAFHGEPGNWWVLIKSVNSKDFKTRPISALGIGMARTKKQVFAAIRKFAPNLAFDCDKSSEMTNRNLPSSCSITLNPGWLTINFDAQNRLTEVRFDGFGAV